MKRKNPNRTKKVIYTALIVFISCFALLLTQCKNQSTAPDINYSPDDNTLLISCSPVSGGTGTSVVLMISVMGNTKEITSFGLEMTFDPAVFKYQSTRKSDLTASWAAVDGNEASPGLVIIGGFMGSGTPVPAGSSGSLAIVNIEVIYDGDDNGFSRQISIENYKDDIGGMKPEPASIAFTFNK